MTTTMDENVSKMKIVKKTAKPIQKSAIPVKLEQNFLQGLDDDEPIEHSDFSPPRDYD